MTVLLFIIVLGLLILAHEGGHFFSAKRHGIRVDEFGIGFPPRALTLGEKKGTTYTLNWIPFGGFVKIFGEDGATAGAGSFASKPWYVRAEVLVAGVVANALLAWLLVSMAFLIGVPVSTHDRTYAAPRTDEKTIILDVADHSPLDATDIRVGDEIIGVENLVTAKIVAGSDTENIAKFIQSSNGDELAVIYRRGKDFKTAFVYPEKGLYEADTYSIGMSFDRVGTIKLPVHKALWYGLRETVSFAIDTVGSLGRLIGGSFTGSSHWSDVAGPVGLAGMIGNAWHLGVSSVFLLAAIISINLSVLNLVPFPALDGGRLIIVFIEAIRKKVFPQKVLMIVNGVGFGLLILLMVVLTVKDVLNLF